MKDLELQNAVNAARSLGDEYTKYPERFDSEAAKAQIRLTLAAKKKAVQNTSSWREVGDMEQSVRMAIAPLLGMVYGDQDINDLEKNS